MPQAATCPGEITWVFWPDFFLLIHDISFYRHKQTHLSLNTNTAKKCGICGKMYVSMPALSMHVLTHNLNHKCHTCGKAFSRPWLLKGHLRYKQNLFIWKLTFISDLTLEINPLVVHIVVNVLLTGQTWELTCKLMQLLRTTSAGNVISHLHWSPTFTSTMSQDVSKMMNRIINIW